MTNEQKLKIANSKKSTIERHSNMKCLTFDVKIKMNKLSLSQKIALDTIFLEAKWYKNYILNWSNLDENNKWKNFDTKQTKISKKDKDLNDVPVEIKYFSASQRQCLISEMYANIKALHSLKIQGYQKPGRLKFIKEINSIGLKQYGMTHIIKSDRKVKIQGIPKTLIVSGVNQFINIPDVEFANARLLKKSTGYYVQFVVYVPQDVPTKEKINKTIGIDFGCSTSFTDSEGIKTDVKIPESERLKRLQKRKSKKVKGSKNWYKQQDLINVEYQKISNKKDDISNKIVSYYKQFEKIVIQDEQLSTWKKGGHGKAVQHSVLGRVKSKLKSLDNVVILSKTVPTTKMCRSCGVYHDGLRPWDRVFECECGVREDRDVHAAENMVWFYENNVGVGRTKFKRVEIKALVDSILNVGSQLVSEKHEAHSL